MKKLAPLLVILAGCLWGTMGLSVRRFTEMGLGSLQVSEIRNIGAVVILLLFCLIRDRKSLKLRPKDLPISACSGVFSIVFFNYCYFRTINMMDLSVAAILLYTAPIFVMLMSAVLFRERITVRKAVALVLALGGCCLVCGLVGSGVSISRLGLLLGLGSGFGYALYSIFTRVSLNRGMSSMSISFYTFVFAAVGAAFLADFGEIAEAFRSYGMSLLLYSLLYALVTTALPYLLYTAGLMYLENGTASTIASVEPVMATVLGFFVYSERPTALTILGILLVLAALVLLNLRDSKSTTEEL